VSDCTRVFLTGFSGTGKSTVATLVAEALGWRAIDIDSQIELAAGREIAEIFESDGEARFRELERMALASAASEERTVIATGGGAIVDVRNRRAMAGGLVVRLDAPSETLRERLGGQSGTRPLLRDIKRLEALKGAREKFYALADLSIETDKLTTDEVAARIVQAVRAGKGLPCDPDRLLLPHER
jgi:shikimate kinase